MSTPRPRCSKTVAQQCKHYNVENFFDYMVERYYQTYDQKVIVELFMELKRDARTLFIRYCFEDMNPEYKKEIISAIVNR